MVHAHITRLHPGSVIQPDGTTKILQAGIHGASGRR